MDGVISTQVSIAMQGVATETELVLRRLPIHQLTLNFLRLLSAIVAEKERGDVVVSLMQVLGALINLSTPGRYIHWGFIQISVANFVVICLMVVVLFLAILIPFHRKGGRS